MGLFLIQATLIIGLPFVIWRWAGLGRFFPLAVVQIGLGLLLGPSVLGTIWPNGFQFLFSPATLPPLDGLGWLGLVLFAFSTGLHFDLTDCRDRSCAFVLSSAASVILPMAVGLVFGLAIPHLLPDALPPHMPVWSMAIGVAIAMGVTALPVLGAILRDMGLQNTIIGQTALACAAVSDAALWLGLAALLAWTGTGNHGPSLPLPLIGTILFGGSLWFAVRPALDRLQRAGDAPQTELLLLSLGVLISAAISDALGLHGVLGAFVFGCIVPRPMAQRLLDRLDALLITLLLPFFFVLSGLKCHFPPGSGTMLIFAVSTVLAMGSKMAAALLPWRFCGWPLRHSLALGSLTACKGMMELVVLTILLDRGIVPPVLFSGLMLMALLSTALARPLADYSLRSTN